MRQPDRGRRPALWQGTASRAGHVTFRAAPSGHAETDADQQCRSYAFTLNGKKVTVDAPGRHAFAVGPARLARCNRTEIRIRCRRVSRVHLPCQRQSGSGLHTHCGRRCGKEDHHDRRPGLVQRGVAFPMGWWIKSLARPAGFAQTLRSDFSSGHTWTPTRRGAKVISRRRSDRLLSA
jgi:hypothetical protein